MLDIQIPSQIINNSIPEFNIKADSFQTRAKQLAYSIEISNNDSTERLDINRAIRTLKDYIFDSNLQDKLGDTEREYDLTINYPIISTSKLQCVVYLTQDDTRPRLSNLLVNKRSKVNYFVYSPTGKTSSITSLKHKLKLTIKGQSLLVKLELDFSRTNKTYTQVTISAYEDTKRVCDPSNTKPLKSLSIYLKKPDNNLLFAVGDENIGDTIGTIIGSISW